MTATQGGLYEIVNPSDPYTLRAPSALVASIAVILVGSGQYGIEAIGDSEPAAMPMFAFCPNSALDEWCLRVGGDTFGALLEANRAAVADCLDSVLFGPADRRAMYEAACAAIDDPQKLERFKAEWHDRRSSMNDIGGRAWAMAAGLRKSPAGAGEEAPCG